MNVPVCITVIFRDWRKLYLFAGVIFLLGLSIYIPREERSQWLSLEFKGVVVSKVQSNNHAVYEYEIRGDKGDTVEVYDRFGTMKKIDVGERVVKKGGAFTVEKIKGQAQKK